MNVIPSFLTGYQVTGQVQKEFLPIVYGFEVEEVKRVGDKVIVRGSFIRRFESNCKYDGVTWYAVDGAGRRYIVDWRPLDHIPKGNSRSDGKQSFGPWEFDISGIYDPEIIVGTSFYTCNFFYQSSATLGPINIKKA